MNNIKYIAFKVQKDWEIYKYDGKGWFLKEGTSLGFDSETVNKYGDNSRFLKSETLEGLNEEIRKRIHSDQYGLGKEGDITCPKCGYKYSFDYYDCNDGYYTAAIIEDFSEIVHCICGCKFTAKIQVTVTWTTELLK